MRRLTPAMLLLLAACGGGGATPPAEEAAAPPEAAPDPHSFANPEVARVERLELELEVDFAARRLAGEVELELSAPAAAGDTLVLDTHRLEILGVTLDGGDAEARWELGAEQPHLGRPLTVVLEPDSRRVRVRYRSDPAAEALQWLDPEQTAGGSRPFLLSQSQAILARTWVPCQDTPAVRFTYSATVRVPPGLLALMSAENPTATSDDGVYRFEMPQPIPSYLLALAVGELEFRALGPRSGVYAEPPLVEAAAAEFADVPAMIAAAERLYGPYRWGRYDLLVLPPSFPFGGMENPRLTFLTPTILAGDRSLVSLVAHELAHSWSGNLVTNATWNDFWLNEGFTSYIENRIMEEIEGAEYAEMLRSLSLQDLEQEAGEIGLDSPDTRLALELAGRNPDDGMTAIAYDKGAALLRRLEEAVGRERWDEFLRAYFDANAFRSITTAGFERQLRERLGDALPDDLDLDGWIHAPGLPADLPRPGSAAFERVDAQLAAWTGGGDAGAIQASAWTTHEWLHFLRGLPRDTPAERLAELDRRFALSDTGNSEILAAWLELAVHAGYRPAYPALERFLTSVGRRKFLKPLYTALAETEDGKTWARRVYATARPGYHAISRNPIDEILGWEG